MAQKFAPKILQESTKDYESRLLRLRHRGVLKPRVSKLIRNILPPHIYRSPNAYAQFYNIDRA